MRPEEPSDLPVETTDFGGLAIEWDRRVLRPRPWTEEQARWAAGLAEAAPPGPILEFYCGAGQIGLLASRLSGRDLVQIDQNEVAASYARRNAAAAGTSADVRDRPVDSALAPEEQFPLVIADPPWLPTGVVDQYPEDPVSAIDGGERGIDLVVESLEVGLRHLSPDGHLVLQVGDPEQVDVVSRWLAEPSGGDPPDRATDHEILEVRDLRPGGLLVHIAPAEDRSAYAGGRSGGQVSETEDLSDAGGPIFPSDATAGYPLDDEHPEEGEAGPDAIPRENRRENET